MERPEPTTFSCPCAILAEWVSWFDLDCSSHINSRHLKSQYSLHWIAITYVFGIKVLTDEVNTSVYAVWLWFENDLFRQSLICYLTTCKEVGFSFPKSEKEITRWNLCTKYRYHGFSLTKHYFIQWHLQVSEERLISLLEQINNQTARQTKVTVSCRLFVHCSILISQFIRFSLFYFFSDTKASKCSRGWWLTLTPSL